jgi:hypothetical protein
MAIIGDAHIEIHALTLGFKNEVERALKDLEPMLQRSGRDMGNAFSKNFNRGMGGGNLFGNFGREAEAARQSFNRLIRTGYKLGPVISLLVSGVADLGMGLFAVGSAAGAAIPSVVALGGAFAAMIQGVATAKIAMGGLGEAMSAMKAPQAGGNNDKAIEDARRRLALVYQRSAEQMASANDKVRDAQISLNRAYEEGLESLQQLGFSAEDAALAQDRAAIQLERSRESLMRVLDLDPNDRARREAELAFKEAELNYRKTTDQVNDLREQQEYAAATGIEGTKEVIDAKNALYEAEADRAKQERDNAQDIAEAQRAIAAAMAASAKSSGAMSEALKKISPEAKKFLEYFISLEDTFLQLRFAAGRGFFPALEIALGTLVEKLFPTLEVVLERTGFVLGGFVKKLANVLTSAKNLDIINRIFGEANLKIFRNLTNSLVNLVDVLFSVLDAAEPLTRIFAAWVERLTQSFKISVAVGNATGQLSEKFLRAGEVAKTIGRFLKTVYEAFRDLGRSAVDAGEKILDYFSQGAEKLKAFTEEGRKTGELAKYFDRVADNFIAISGFLGEIIIGLFALGGNPGVGQFFEALKPVTEMLVKIAYTLSSTGPLLAEFANQFTRMLLVFTETGGIEMFFKVLTAALTVLANIFTNDLVVRVFMFLAAVKGLTLAFGTILTVAKFAFKVLVGNLLVIPSMANKAALSVGALSGAVKGLSASVMLMAEKVYAATFSMAVMNKQAGFGVAAGLASMKKSLMTLGIALQGYASQLMFAGDKALLAGKKWLFSSASLKSFGRALIAPTIGLKMLTGAIVKSAVAFLAHPVGWFALALVALAAVLYKAYQASEPLQKAVSELGDAITGTLNEGLDMLLDVLRQIFPDLESMNDLFKKIGDFIAKYLIPPIQWLITSVLKVWIGQIVVGLSFLINAFKFLFNIVKFVVGMAQAFILIFTSAEDKVSILRESLYGVINAFVDFGNSVKKVLNWINPFGDGLEMTAKYGEEVKKNQIELPKAFVKTSQEMAKNARNAEKLTTNYGSLTDITNMLNGALETEFEKQTTGARAIIDAVEKKKQLAETNKALKESLNGTTKGTIDSTSALYDFADSYLEAIESSIAAGDSQKEVTRLVKQGRDAFVDGAKSIGYSADEAERLAEKLGLTPEVIKKTFETKGLGDLKAAVGELDKLEKLIKTGQVGRVNGKQMGDAAELTRAAKDSFNKQSIALNAALKLEFGKGQTKKDPLYVEVTNQGMAIGGPVSSSRSYLVGEKGPEIFSPASSGTIIPNDKIGVGGGMSITVNAGPGMDEMELASVVSRKVAWTMRRGA